MYVPHPFILQGHVTPEMRKAVGNTLHVGQEATHAQAESQSGNGQSHHAPLSPAPEGPIVRDASAAEARGSV